jgi:hypothetical protein
MLPKKLPTMADRLLVVSPLCPDDVVSHHP